MTPAERAEKIWHEVRKLEGFMVGNAIPIITAQIEEAEREAEKKADILNKEGFNDALDEGFRKGFSAGFNDGFTSAKERAKGIAERSKHSAGITAMGPMTACDVIADRISAMTPEDKK